MEQDLIAETELSNEHCLVSQRLASVLELTSPVQDEGVSLTEHQRVLLNKADAQGNTVLFSAVERGEVGNLRFLLWHGADVNHRNKNKQRAVDVVWEMLDNDVVFYDCMMALLNGGSFFPEPFDASYVTDSEHTPQELKSFVQERLQLQEMIVQLRVDKVREFSSKCDVSRFFTVTNESPVHFAVQHGTEEVLAALLSLSFPLPDEKITLSENALKLLNQVSKGSTPLLAAANAGRKENVEFLVRCGADTGFHNQDGKCAVDVTWDNKHYDCVLCLLQADSNYPAEFQLECLSTDDESVQKLKEFVLARDKLHELIACGETEDVKTYINTVSNPSSLYLNSKGESALFATLKNPQQLRDKIYAYLKYKGLRFKNSEEEESLYNVNENQKQKLKQVMIESFPQIPDAHISYIVSKSKPSESRENFRNEVEEIYRKLNDIPEVSILLQVIQYNDYVEVVLDFERDYVSHMDPQHGSTTKGATDYKDGRIYVGFKMTTLEEENERLGTLAHELCHLAMQIVYQNNCNPYARNEKDKKSSFEEIVREMKEKPAVDIIRNVYTAYKDESQWPSELIVRVPQILATFGREVGKDILRNEARNLNSFFNLNVKEDCEKLVEENYLIKPRNIIRLLNQYLGQIFVIEKAGIEFENDSFQYNTFDHSGILLYSSHSTWLSSISIYQAIHEKPQYSLRGSCLFLNINNFESLQDDIMYAFRSKACGMMVVDCCNILDKVLLTQVVQSIGRILIGSKKVVFIATKEINENLLQDIVEDQNLPSKYIKIQDKDFDLTDLRSGSQTKILSKKVLFQGIELTLNDLVNEESKTAINSQALTKIIREGELKVGDEIRSLGDIECYYIERGFTIIEEISPSIFSDQSVPDLLFISGPARKSIPKDHKICLSKQCSVSEEEQFTNLCSQKPACNIHWLECEYGRLLWIRSHGLIDTILKHRAVEKPRQCSEEDILFRKSYNNVTIISDKTGMGKSTVLTVLGKKIKDKFKFLWVVRIDLNNYLYQFKKLETKWCKQKGSCEKKQNHVLIRFLVEELLTFHTKTDKRLFEYSLKNGKVSFLFDGFDEISPVYKDMVIELLQVLKTCHVHDLIVTTRPYMVRILEEKLGAFSCGLKSFNKENQKIFLVEFWKNKFSILDTDEKAINELDMYADRLIKVLSSLTSDRNNSFSGIPLQMRMVAEIFPEEKESTQDDSFPFCSSEMSVPQKFNMIQLYELFIHKKYSIYKLEKLKHYTVAAEVLADLHFEIFVQNHQKLALLYLFTEKQCALLLPEKEVMEIKKLIRLIEEGKEKTGLIDQVIFDGEEPKPNFVHRTFAEYFAAQILADSLKEVQSREFHLFIVKDVLVSPGHEVLRNFLNNHFEIRHIGDDVLTAFGDSIRFLWQLDQKSLCDERDRTGLYIAVLEENVEIVKIYLKGIRKHNDVVLQIVNAVDNEGRSALHIAVNNSVLEVVEMLVDNGADVNIPDNKGETALHHASVSDDLDILQFLVSKGANINAADENGKTALHKSVAFGCWPACQFLVEQGADISAVDQDKQSIIYKAAGRANFETVQLMSEKGADVCAKDKEGVSPFLKAASVGDCEIMEYLLQRGAEVNARDVFGRSALHRAAYGSGSFEAVQFLVDRGADINVADEDGSVPLHEAASVGDREMCQLFLDRGADVSAADNNERSALQHAVRSGSLETVQFLVSRGADIAGTDVTGMGPLLEAANKGDWDILDFLLKQPCDVNTKDKNGQSALQKTVSSGNLNAMQLVISYGADINAADNYGKQPIHEAASKHDLEMLKILLDLEADPNVKTNSGQTSLHMAAGRGNYKLVNMLTDESFDDHIIDDCDIDDWPIVELSVNQKANSEFTGNIPDSQMFFVPRKSESLQAVSLLIERGADVNATDQNLSRPLHGACRVGDSEVIQLLLDKGADVTARDKNGKSPLHLAASGCGSQQDIDLLIDRGAVIDAKDLNGVQPIHDAAGSGNREAMESLIRKVADVDTRDNNGKTPLHMAAKGLIEGSDAVDANDPDDISLIYEDDLSGNLEIIELLIAEGADVNARDSCGKSPLHMAASGRGSEQDAQSLTDSDAIIDDKGLNGVQPIHEATSSGNLEVMALLLRKGADINATDNNGKSILEMVTYGINCLEVVHFLVENGLNIHENTSIKNKLLHEAISNQNLELINFLQYGGPCSSPGDTSE